MLNRLPKTDRRRRARSLAPLLLLIASTALAQTGPHFQAASIKPSASGTQGEDIQSLSAGRFSIRGLSLSNMIYGAFRVRSFEVSGIPPWAATARYDVTARAARPVDAAEMWPMVVPLLQERFKMRFHRETRESPIYNLSVIKSGKLPAPKPENCNGLDPNRPPSRPAPDKRMITTCGNTLTPITPGALEIYGGSVTMETLASRLEDLLGKRVVDRTGFTAKFDLDLKFAIDESLPAIAARSGGKPRKASNASAPNIFTAVRDQLGLNLEAAKASASVIVIDHIEPPSSK